MNRKRKWTEEQLRAAARKSRSIRQVLSYLGLVEAGGNYSQVKKFLEEYQVKIDHFKGRGWNKGLKGIGKPHLKIEKILISGSNYQSFKLKRRLFNEGFKKPECELCGWAKKASDGRIPLELDHINGNRKDNRLQNLRILCPNCHSLQPTHRGLNTKKKK